MGLLNGVATSQTSASATAQISAAISPHAGKEPAPQILRCRLPGAAVLIGQILHPDLERLLPDAYALRSPPHIQKLRTAVARPSKAFRLVAFPNSCSAGGSEPSRNVCCAGRPASASARSRSHASL